MHLVETMLLILAISFFCRLYQHNKNHPTHFPVEIQRSGSWSVKNKKLHTSQNDSATNKLLYFVITKPKNNELFTSGKICVVLSCFLAQGKRRKGCVAQMSTVIRQIHDRWVHLTKGFKTAFGKGEYGEMTLLAFNRVGIFSCLENINILCLLQYSKDLFFLLLPQENTQYQVFFFKKKCHRWKRSNTK